jgi:SsrA-binding protein
MKNCYKLITKNKKARHDYHIVDTFEAGIVLQGSEVKSCRQGSVNLKDSYGRIVRGEIFLVNAHISQYRFANRFNHEPVRNRKLLFHKQEIKKFYGKLRERGLSLIPLAMYFNERGKVKVEMALARGKKQHDKREEIKRKDLKREMQRSREPWQR